MEEQIAKSVFEDGNVLVQSSKIVGTEKSDEQLKAHGFESETDSNNGNRSYLFVIQGSDNDQESKKKSHVVCHSSIEEGLQQFQDNEIASEHNNLQEINDSPKRLCAVRKNNLAELDYAVRCTDAYSVKYMESLLAVPVKYIIKRAGAESNSLLSSVEANLLLAVTKLAYEIDLLLEMSLESMERTKMCNHISNGIVFLENHYLFPFQSVLYLHGIVIPQKVLQYVQLEIERILTQFPIIIQTLHQLAEQNWSVSNTLTAILQTNGDFSVNNLGKEKSNLAEVEDELCRRLEQVMYLCRGEKLFDGDIHDLFLRNEPMKFVCKKLFDAHQ